MQSFKEPDQLCEALWDTMRAIGKAAIERHSRFTLAISGEPIEVSKYVWKGLGSYENPSWKVFFADEKLTGDDTWINSGIASSAPRGVQIYDLDKELCDSPTDLADQYMADLRDVFASANTVRFPVFDLIVAGVGPHGQTCGLFPEHEILSESVDWIAPVEDAPDNCTRISFCLPLVNHAHHLIIIANRSDLDKFSKIKKTLPCHMLRPVHGEITWLILEDTTDK
ncbi:suppressor of los1-1 [Apophysomyces sp. BC1034]|nr:suppressor of los1-1 [Apophysomyces sp. BC1034]